MDVNKKNLKENINKIEELEQYLTFRISRMTKLMEEQVSEMLINFGLTITEFRILLIIEIFDEISSADISRIGLFDRGVVSRTTKQLKKMGLIGQKDAPRNKLKKLLFAEEKGRKLVEEVKPLNMKRENTLSSYLSEEEMELFKNTIGKLSTVLIEKSDL